MPPNVNGIFETIQGHQFLVKVMFNLFRIIINLEEFTYFIFFIYPILFVNDQTFLHSHQNYKSIFKEGSY
jgi:hypothetical protein